MTINNTLSLIGNTPLVMLKGASAAAGCEIYGKCEFYNPGASIKDRAALYIVRDAEAHGLLKPGGTIVEGTAGNTGIGLALVATALGAMLAPKAWEGWTEAILGLWMIMSPWVLVFTHMQAAMYMAVGVGLITVILALWTIATDKDFSLPKSMMP